MQNPHWTNPLKGARKTQSGSQELIMWISSQLQVQCLYIGNLNSAITGIVILLNSAKATNHSVLFSESQFTSIHGTALRHPALESRMPDTDTWEPFTDFKGPGRSTQSTCNVNQAPTVQGRFFHQHLIKIKSIRSLPEIWSQWGEGTELRSLTYWKTNEERFTWVTNNLQRGTVGPLKISLACIQVSHGQFWPHKHQYKWSQPGVTWGGAKTRTHNLYPTPSSNYAFHHTFCFPFHFISR